MKKVVILSAFLILLSAAVQAQVKQVEDNQEERLLALEERVRELEAEVQALKASRATPGLSAKPADPSADPPALQAAGAAPPSQLPVYGGAGAMAKVLNPDISAIGDFIGSVGRAAMPGPTSPVQPLPTLQMHESEVGFQAIVDPYARGDFFLSFGEEGVNLEEGYITFTALPGGIVAKVGKMRSAFGIVNTLHNHTLPWIDRPLVTENLVGGEDGIDDAGLSLDRLWAGPKGIVLETTGQVFRGDSGEVFTASRRSDASVVGHLRAYRDLTESTNLDLGLSYARGHNDLGTDFLTNLYGIDAAVRWKPLRRAIYHSFLGRAELVWSRRDQLPTRQRAFGFYTMAEYRLNRRWTLGGRYDRSDRARAGNLTDNGGSAVITYWPSEFSQVRAQYRFTRFAEERDGNELLFQFLFVLGAHGAHPF